MLEKGSDIVIWEEMSYYKYGCAIEIQGDEAQYDLENINFEESEDENGAWD